MNPFSSGAGINNRGYVVGNSNHLDGYIWRGKRMQSLRDLIDPRQGWESLNPQAINDAGQIIAIGFRNRQTYSVRLDLIRPHTDAVPAAETDEEASVAPLEVAKPVTQ